MITGNKGEWSEIYTLLKLLGDKILYPGDSNLQKIKGGYYPILRILRSETSGDYEYSIQDELIVISGKEKIAVPIKKFQENSLVLLSKIKSADQRTFSVPEIEFFMNEISCISLKASSSTKTDITIIVHDQRTNQQPILGFSIKSQLGGASTLLNAGKTTNFIFKIENIHLNAEEIEKINSFSTGSKIKYRIKTIRNHKGIFKFLRTENHIFGNNLALIDSSLPEILANVVFNFFTSSKSTLQDLVDELGKKNPLDYDLTHNHQFYIYKIKRFLVDVALGMMPSKVWSGKIDATGGYLVVKEDGEIVCYHIYGRNDFENYLLANTKLETASSTRHKFGSIYEKDGKYFMKLNLQIRFIK